MTKTIDLDNIRACDPRLAGGKASALGKLLQNGITVPKGFVITTNAFNEGMSTILANEIFETFEKLGVERVAVRSSSVGEDSKTASWAGQLDTFLNVTRDDLLKAIGDCWDSIKSDRAVHYAMKHKSTKEHLGVAVIVQAMVDSKISGVLFTANPINQSKDEYVIEDIFGLGELLVQGRVTPETLIIDAHTGDVLKREIHQQTKMLVYQGNDNIIVPLPKRINQQNILKDNQISILYDVAKRISDYFGRPQDIEWAFDKDSLYILQSRPITTLISNKRSR